MRSVVVIAFVLTAGFASADEPQFTPGIVNTQSAISLCDEWGLKGPEGIWQLTDSDTKVLIFRRSTDELASLPVYDITAVSPPDMSIETGEILGTCVPTADPSIYILDLYSKRDKNGKLTSKKRFQAKLDASGRNMTNTADKLKFSINLSRLFPSLGNILRIYYDPVGKTIRGFKKIYPGIDPDGSLPGQIRML